MDNQKNSAAQHLDLMAAQRELINLSLNSSFVAFQKLIATDGRNCPIKPHAPLSSLPTANAQKHHSKLHFFEGWQRVKKRLLLLLGLGASQ